MGGLRWRVTGMLENSPLMPPNCQRLPTRKPSQPRRHAHYGAHRLCVLGRSIGWPSASCVFKCCKVTAAPANGQQSSPRETNPPTSRVGGDGLRGPPKVAVASTMPQADATRQENRRKSLTIFVILDGGLFFSH